MANRSGKGGEFERQFSKDLSKYISGGTRDDIFWRSSQSGGRATQRAKQGKLTEGSYGDITTLDHRFAFVTEVLCFELKRGYNDANIQDLLDSNKKEPELIAFFNQCERDRKLGSRKFSCIVMKKDRKKAIIAIPRTLWNLLSREVGKRLFDVIHIDYADHRMSIFRLNDFIKKYPYKSFISVLKAQL